MCRVNYLSLNRLQNLHLVTSFHNDADDVDTADDANDYNRVIGIAQLKAFSCAKNKHLLSLILSLGLNKHLNPLSNICKCPFFCSTIN